MIDAPEKRAIVSGIGISRIGRRTGVPGLELTLESARAAIADAGLHPAEIDGVATLGETPLADAVTRLGIEPGYAGGGFDSGGLLAPVMGACLAGRERTGPPRPRVSHRADDGRFDRARHGATGGCTFPRRGGAGQRHG